MTTLKDRYQARQTGTLKERARIREAIVLREDAAARILIEAMDQSDLDRASKIIEKMRNVKGKGLETLDVAIDQAEAELNKFTGGGALSQVWSKIKTKMGGDNPFVKTMAFINAIEAGFKQIPQILKNNTDGIDLNSVAEKPLTQIVTDIAKQKVIAQNIAKALTPSGVFAAFKGIPYIDKKQLVVDLLNTPLKNLSAISAAVNQGAKTSDIAADLKDAASDSPEATGTASTDAAAPTKQTSGSTPAKSTTASQDSSNNSATKKSAASAKKIYDNIFGDFADAGVSADGAMKIIQSMIDNDLVKA